MRRVRPQPPARRDAPCSAPARSPSRCAVFGPSPRRPQESFVTALRVVASSGADSRPTVGEAYTVAYHAVLCAWRPGSGRARQDRRKHRGTTDTPGGTPADDRCGSRRGRRRRRRAGFVAERPRADRRRRVGPAEGGPSAGARRFRRDPGRGGAPGRNDAGRRGRVAGRLPAASRHPRFVRRFSHLGSGHGPVPEEPGRGGPHRAGAGRGDGRGGPAGGRVAPPATGGEQVLLRAARQRHRDPAPGDLVGRADAVHDAPARGEADALLARALRDRQHEGPRHADDAAAERDAARQRQRELRGPADGHPQGPGDARVSGQRRERQGSPERELRPRAAGAVQPRRRQLHRAGHSRRSARVHRLDQRRPGVRVRRRAARLRREDVPRTDRSVRRRRHHPDHPGAAGRGRVRERQALPVLRPRRARRVGPGRVWRPRCATPTTA